MALIFLKGQTWMIRLWISSKSCSVRSAICKPRFGGHGVFCYGLSGVRVVRSRKDRPANTVVFAPSCGSAPLTQGKTVEGRKPCLQRSERVPREEMIEDQVCLSELHGLSWLMWVSRLVQGKMADWAFRRIVVIAENVYAVHPSLDIGRITV